MNNRIRSWTVIVQESDKGKTGGMIGTLHSQKHRLLLYKWSLESTTVALQEKWKYHWQNGSYNFNHSTFETNMNIGNVLGIVSSWQLAELSIVCNKIQIGFV